MEILGYKKEVNNRDLREENFQKKVENFKTGIFRGTFKTTRELLEKFKSDLGKNLTVKKLEPRKEHIWDYKQPEYRYFRLLFVPLYLKSDLYDYSSKSYDWFRDNEPKLPNGLLFFKSINSHHNQGFIYLKDNQTNMLIQKNGLIDFIEAIDEVNFENILFKIHLISQWVAKFFMHFRYADTVKVFLEIGNARNQIIQPKNELQNEYIISEDRSLPNFKEFNPYQYYINTTIDLFNSVFGMYNLRLSDEIINEKIMNMGLTLAIPF